MYVCFQVEWSLFLSDFNKTWYFSTCFQKNTQISNFIKIHPVGANLFHADGRADKWTDMTKLIVALHNFANALKKSVYKILPKILEAQRWDTSDQSQGLHRDGTSNQTLKKILVASFLELLLSCTILKTQIKLKKAFAKNRWYRNYHRYCNLTQGRRRVGKNLWINLGSRNRPWLFIPWFEERTISKGCLEFQQDHNRLQRH